MQEGIFFIAHINKCCVKAWNYSMYFTKINIAHGEILASFFFVKLRQDFVLQIGNINFVGLGIDYKLKIHDKSVKYLKPRNSHFWAVSLKNKTLLKKLISSSCGDSYGVAFCVCALPFYGVCVFYRLA